MRQSRDGPDGMTYDEALSKHIGQFGPGQWRQLFWASIPQVACAAIFFLWVFITVDPVANHSWKCSSPTDAACAAVWRQEVPSSSSFCSLSPGQWQWTSQDSLVARFNLVCGDAWKVQFTNSLMFMGAFLGSGLFGVLCDRWGRRRPLFLATSLIAVSMFASLAAPSFWMFAVLRAMTGLGAAGQSHCNFLLSTEPVGPSFRGLAGLCTLFFWVVGEFVIVGLGFGLPAWQHLLIACGAINAASLLLYPLVPESGRWLLSKGRTDEARQFLERVARGNGSRVPPERLTSSHSSKQLAAAAPGGDVEAACAPAVVARLEAGGSEDGSTSSADDTGELPAGCPQAAEAPVDLGQLLRRPRLVHRLAILLVNSFTLTGNFYGISMAAGGIPGSIYMTFAIGVAAEAFAAVIVAPSVDRFGRHNIVSLGQLVGGIACIACAIVSGGKQQAALAAIGKFGCSAASSVNPIYIAELLPTSCRSSVMGICSQASRVGSVAAPFLLMLGTQLVLPGRSQVFLPFLVFGCLAILSGLAIMTMPETLGAPMPENVADLENLLSVFAAKPWRNGLSSLVAFVFRTRARRASADVASTCGSSSSAVSSTGSSCSVDAEAHVGVGIAGVTVIVRQRPPGGLQKQLGREGSEDDADQTK